MAPKTIISLPTMGQIVDDRFELLEAIGSGGMATVFKATDQWNGNHVALKMLHQATESTRRFAREARVLAAFNHPAIVGYVADGIAENGAPYLAMDWLKGHDLSEHLKQGAQPTESEVLDLALRVVDALRYSHENGVIHRDIKPGNLFLVEGRMGRVKILDFGIARATRTLHGTSVTRDLIGTPAYMSPEQARSRVEIDGRSDLFSLGCVLFQCLAGRAPFTGDHALAVIMKIALEDAPRLSEVAQDIKADWDEIIARCLKRDPIKRYDSAGDLHDALLRFKENIPLSSRSVTGITRLEERITSVVLAATAIAAQDTIEGSVFDGSVHDGHATLIAAARSFGAQVERLNDGTIVAFLTRQSLPGEQAASAARCALAMHAANPMIPLVLATGRHTSGRDLHSGDIIDRAVELLESSEVGRPSIDKISATLLEGRFYLEQRSGQFYLGHEREVPRVSYRLLGKPSPCVGRRREISQVRTLWQFSMEEPASGAILIVGETGIGKSRLIHEAVSQETEQSNFHPRVMIGRANSLGAGAPFGMLSQAIRRTAQIVRNHDPETARRKLVARMCQTMPQHKVDEISPFIGDIAGIPLGEEDPNALRAARAEPSWMCDRLTTAWVDWMRAESKAAPVLLILEDLQWGDLPSIQLVDSALRQLEDEAFQVVALGRPEVSEKFPRIWEERNLTTIQLRSLSRKAQQTLVQQVIAEELTAEQIEQLLDQANGNPLFLEELLRTAIINDENTLPDNILGMIQHRLDALDATTRQLLRAASVFGQIFWPGGLRAVLGLVEEDDDVDHLLARLTEDEWIDLTPDSIFESEPQYQFTHSLVRETAYASLTSDDQVTGHLLAGTWLETMGGVEAQGLADHFRLGDKLDSACFWYAQATREALDGADPTAVLQRAELGIECGASGQDLATFMHFQAEACWLLGDMTQSLEHARSACSSFEAGSAQWYRSVARAIVAANNLNQQDVATEWLDAVQVRKPENFIGREERLLTLTCGLHEWVLAGKMVEASTLLEVILQDAGDLQQWTPLLEGRLESVRFLTEMTTGNLGVGMQHGVRAIAAFDQIATPREALMPRIRLGWAYTEVGDYESAERVLREAIETAENLGHAAAADYARSNLGHTLTRMGQFDEGIAELRRSLNSDSHQSDVRSQAGRRGYIALSLWFRGDHDEAEIELNIAHELSVDYPPMLMTVKAGLASVFSSMDQHQDALEQCEIAMAHLDGGGTMDALEARLRLTHVQTLIALNRKDEASTALQKARERLDERSQMIVDEKHRRLFRERVTENAQTFELAQAFLPIP